jgi:hypothetical protein
MYLENAIVNFTKDDLKVIKTLIRKGIESECKHYFEIGHTKKQYELEKFDDLEMLSSFCSINSNCNFFEYIDKVFKELNNKK